MKSWLAKLLGLGEPAPRSQAAATSPAPASPSEVVKAAAALPGVSGALLSMQDGLSIAKQLPATLNGDTLAAFIPDIFNRLGNYARDLNLGEISSVTIQVGGQPLHVLKSGKLYLAILGRPGEPLPGETRLSGFLQQLAALNT